MGIKCNAISSGTPASPKSTGTTKIAVLQITNAGTLPVTFPGMRPVFSAYGVVPTDPKGQITLERGATGGTGSSTITPVKMSNNTALPTGPATTAKEHFATTQPTGGTEIAKWSCHPQGESICPVPLDDLKPGETLTMFAHFPTTAANYSAMIPFQEG